MVVILIHVAVGLLIFGVGAAMGATSGIRAGRRAVSAGDEPDA